MAGGFVSERIEDYHLNLWELGYGQFVKLDTSSSVATRWAK